MEQRQQKLSVGKQSSICPFDICLLRCANIISNLTFRLTIDSTQFRRNEDKSDAWWRDSYLKDPHCQPIYDRPKGKQQGNTKNANFAGIASIRNEQLDKLRAPQSTKRRCALRYPIHLLHTSLFTEFRNEYNAKKYVRFRYYFSALALEGNSIWYCCVVEFNMSDIEW